MRCPNCDSTLSLKSNRCEQCGEDIRVYKKVIKSSNAYYNLGLEKAKVRDLSGAIIALRNSLELNKKNTNARNLLGLVYFEMGETVSALSEWVISKHFQSENNDADEYMKNVQSNPSKLEVLNQAIKKYNSALNSAKQNSQDLAIIQLKKVVNLNPKFIRAYQLLALLYIQDGEKEKAKKILYKANAIDLNNTITLQYLKELGALQVKTAEYKEKDTKDLAPTKRQMSEFKMLTTGTYKEEKPNIWVYLNLVIGVVIGILGFYILIGPTIRSTAIKDSEAELRSKTTQISSLEVEKSDLENEKTSLQEQISNLETQLAEYTSQTEDESVKNIYESLFTAAKSMIGNDKEAAALALVNVKEENIELEAAKDIYNTIKDTTFASVSRTLYSKGYTQYSSYKYEEAITTLENAVKLDESNTDALYFLARAYQQNGNKEKAIEYYTILVEQYGSTKRGNQAQTQLNGLQ